MPFGSSVYGDMCIGVAMAAGTMLPWNERRALPTTTTRGTDGGRGGGGEREDEDRQGANFSK